MKKSKFLTFILSCVPGLGHIYLGLYTRGSIFLFAEIAVIFMLSMMHQVIRINIGAFLGILIPVIWLAALVDSMVLVDKINKFGFPHMFIGDENAPSIAQNGTHNSDFIAQSREQMESQNKKVISMVLSIIPGAGHMYLGLQRQGLQLMIIFFLCFFLTDWLSIGLFMVFIPIIWFFGLFDVMYKASGEEMPEDKDIMLVSLFKGKGVWIKEPTKAIGYVLLLLGCFLLFEKIVLPEIEKLMSWNIRTYMQTGLVALLFIAGGFKLIMGNRNGTDENRRGL